VTNVLMYFLIVVEAIVSFMLIGIILIQKTKSQGMGLAFGSGMGESLFGSQVGNVLTKATVVLSIIFLINTTLLAMLGAGRRTSSVTDSITDTMPAMPAPAEMPQEPSPIVDASPAMMPQEPVHVAPMAAPAAEAVAAPVDVPAPSEAEGQMPPAAQ